MKKILIILAILVIVPISFSQDPLSMDTEAIRVLAEQKAKEDTSAFLWFAGGCIMNVWAILGGMIYEPNPPAAMMVGKSTEYIQVLRDYYNRAAQKIQTKAAMWGCAGSTVGYSLMVVAYYWYITEYFIEEFNSY